VHAIAGIAGALPTDVFTLESIDGVRGDVASQLYGVAVTVVYSGVMTAVILGVIAFVVGLRVTPEHERDGLDLTQHGEKLS
jgi:Amt family ammonium transporter